jgi:hypothetical protein
MLLHQGAAAFTLWTGSPAPLEAMGDALAAARADGVRSAEGEPAGADDGEASVAAEAASTADGEQMLLHQGAAAFTLWTGMAAPIEVMQSARSVARAGGVRSAEGEPAGDEPAPAAAGS